MSRDRIARLEQVYERWGAGDFRDTSIFDDGVVYERVGTEGAAVTGSWRGLERTGEAVREWLEVWRDYRIHAEGYRELGDGRVLVDTRFSGRTRDSDVVMDRPGADIWTFEGEKAVRLTSCWDREDAYRGAGLTP